MLNCCRLFRRLFYCVLLAALLPAAQAAPTKTVVNDIIYRADGSPATGTLLISWPAFTTADREAVAAGSLSVNVGPAGAVSLQLVPNAGATPADSGYRVVMKLDDGTTATEFWIVPATGSAVIADLRVAVPRPASVGAGDTRVNWGAPGAIGSITPNTGAFTTLYSNSGPVVDVAAFAPVTCNGVVDDTAAINAAMAAAGSMHAPPTTTYVGQTTNQRQKTVRFPSNGQCRWTAASAIAVPPGVFVDLNNSTINVTNNAGSGLAFEYDYLGGYGYGLFFGGAANGFIKGPGAGVSTGRGLFLDVASFGRFSNLQIQGFKFGVTAWETQYTHFEHVYATNNVVGFYLTARPTDTTLASLDNTFTDIVADLNTKYGIWAQALSSSQFDRVDASRNGGADIVLGQQLGPYISHLTVTNGGSGCGNNTTIPLQITDASGTMAQAYAVTNGSGTITAAYVVDGGDGYVTPVVAASACTGAPAITATITNDAGLGDWDGASGINRGALTFNTVKSEHVVGADGPARGYAVVVNNTSIRSVTFNNYQLQRQTGGNPSPYFRLAYNKGFGTTFNFPADSSDLYSATANPAAAGDVSIFRNVTAQGLTVRWNGFTHSGNPFPYVIWSDNSVPYGGFGQHTDAFTGDGKKLAVGYQGVSSWEGANFLESKRADDTQFRFAQKIDGTLQWGPGGVASLDSNLYRNGANQLKTDSAFVAGGSATFHGGVSTGTLATGTAPYQTSSTTLNPNLNADLVDGHHAADFLLSTTPLAQSKTCPGTDKLSAFDSATGTFTCSADQGGTSADVRTVCYIAGAENAAAALTDADDQPEFFVNLFGRTYRATSAKCKSDIDNGGAAKPRVQLTNNGNVMFTDNANAGCDCAQSAWTACTVSANTANRDLADGQALGFTMVAAGGAAKRVTVCLAETAQ